MTKYRDKIANSVGVRSEQVEVIRRKGEQSVSVIRKGDRWLVAEHKNAVINSTRFPQCVHLHGYLDRALAHHACRVIHEAIHIG